MDWHKIMVAPIDAISQQAAIERQQTLTKPPGSLGTLENVAIRLAGMQGRAQPAADKIHIAVFAADHGVAAEGVSAFPQAVTAEMVCNFGRGGAAINVLANDLQANLEIINLGTIAELEPLVNVSNARISAGTANFTRQAAMDDQQLQLALQAGEQAVRRAQYNGAELFIGGEMGIGNTSSATAVACALLGLPAAQLAGPGTGLDSKGVLHKIKVIQKALDLHTANIHSPMDALRYVGGYEIAALVGSYLSCARTGIPVLIDGFIASVAALCASRMHNNALDWFIFSHESAEPGHQAVLKAMEEEPLLSLGMRLGEASGAAVAVPLIRIACKLHNGMATFDEAMVSEKKG